LSELGNNELFRLNEDRVRHRAKLIPLLEARLRQKTTADWEKCLLAAEVPHAPVWDYATLLADPQAAARGLRMTVKDGHGNPVDLIGSPFHIDGTPAATTRFPPELGADTDGVFKELLGLDKSNVERLRQQGIVGGATKDSDDC
jgi:crotonobetainyl-CoA:carnitine CoA-transferase CaiB-like acyl-CoA transferase